MSRSLILLHFTGPPVPIRQGKGAFSTPYYVSLTDCSRSDYSTTQGAWVYSHGGPIRRRERGYILMTDQLDAGSVGIFS
eukprot:2829502-Pyramimonas_sp.AAC.2